MSRRKQEELQHVIEMMRFRKDNDVGLFLHALFTFSSDASTHRLLIAFFLRLNLYNQVS
jgi:hypothetical protein